MAKTYHIVFPKTVKGMDVTTHPGFEEGNIAVQLGGMAMFLVNSGKSSVFVFNFKNGQWNPYFKVLLKSIAKRNKRSCWGLVSKDEQHSLYQEIIEDSDLMKHKFVNPNTGNQMVMFTMRPA